MIIRPANIKDLDLLTELFEGYRKFYRKKPNSQTARNFLYSRLVRNDSRIFVCENSEKLLIGFVQLYPIFSSTRMKKLWLLNDLFVSPDARGKGVSKLLIERAKLVAMETGAAGLMLETEVSNEIGNKLYPSTGFELLDKSNFYEWNNPHSETGIPIELQGNDPIYKNKPLHFKISIGITMLAVSILLAVKESFTIWLMLGVLAIISSVNSSIGIIRTYSEGKNRKDASIILVFQVVLLIISVLILGKIFYDLSTYKANW